MMTQRQFMEKVIATATEQEMVEFATAFIEKLDRANASKKATMSKTQKENVAIKEAIATMLVGKTLPACEVAKALEVSTSKASALLTQMVNAGIVVKTVIKQKSHYTMAETSEDAE